MFYAVSQRTRGICFKMALGARSMDKLRMVLGQAMKMVLIGGAIGLDGKPRYEAEEKGEVMKQAYIFPLLLAIIVPALAPALAPAPASPLSPALAQDQRPAGIGRIETRYDRIADTTTVQCDLIELGKGAPRLIIQANASFSGKQTNETVTFWLGLSSYK